MATVVACAHRHHAFWLRVLEDLAIVSSTAVVGWLLVAAVRPSIGQSGARLAYGLFSLSSPVEEVPLSIAEASRPLMEAVKAAVALEGQGVFGVEAAVAWHQVKKECERLAFRPIATGRGTSIMLWILEAEEERAEELASLSAAAGKTPEEIEDLVMLRAEAIRNAAIIRCYRDIVNFDHWKEVSEVEASAPCLAAREAAWLAVRAVDAGRPADARDALESSFRSWRAVLDTRPTMLHDPLIQADLVDTIGMYRGVLAALGGEFPRPFILQDVLDEAGPKN